MCCIWGDNIEHVGFWVQHRSMLAFGVRQDSVSCSVGTAELCIKFSGAVGKHVGFCGA